MLPTAVDRLPFVVVAWLTNQLIEHESDSEKWWKHPVGFNLLDSNDADADPFSMAVAPPAGWERLPFHEEEEQF